jgi:solute carrier family 35, member F5
VSLKDSEDDANAPSQESLPLLGDFMATLGAAMYGIYTTLLKLRIHHESRVDMPLFFGFVGAYCLFSLFPFIFILSFLGIEPFEWPQSTSITICILVLH